MTTVSDRVEAWIPSTDTLGTRLAMVRQRMGWNVKEAALACALAAQSWRNWEAGKNPQDTVTVCRSIASRTGVDLHWLLTGEIQPTQNLKYTQEKLDLPGFLEVA